MPMQLTCLDAAETLQEAVSTSKARRSHALSSHRTKRTSKDSRLESEGTCTAKKPHPSPTQAEHNAACKHGAKLAHEQMHNNLMSLLPA